MIAYEQQKQFIEDDIKKHGDMYRIKYLKEKNENPAGIQIYPKLNTVLNIVYSDKNNSVVAIKIKNKKLTQSYLNLFHQLWGE
jgi:hypothetical protein